MRNLPSLAFALSSLLVAHGALADRAKAVTLYHAGEALFSKGDFRGAANSFDAAFKEEPRGAAAYNAAESWESANELVRAADDFEASLKAGDLNPDLAKTAHEHLAVLDQKLAHLHLDGAAGTTVQVAQLEGAALPVDLRVVPGRYTIHAKTSAGTVFDKDVDVTAGAPLRVDVAPPPPPPQVVPPPVDTPPPQPGMTGIIGKSTLPVGIAFGAVGVALAATSIGLGFATVSASDDYQASGYHSQDLHDQAVSLRLWTNVTLVGAIIMGAVGIGALATLHKQKTEVSFGPGLVSGRF